MLGILDRFRAVPAPNWEAVVDQHYDPVWRFCLRQLGPNHADDAAQETFLTAIRRWPTYRGTGELRTWLFGIALNHCRNLRRQHRLTVPFDFLVQQAAALGSDDPNRVVDRGDLTAALGRLSTEHQEVVLLHELEGLTYAEIGALLGIPEGTVKSRLYHALRRLREAPGTTQEVNA